MLRKIGMDGCSERRRVLKLMTAVFAGHNGAPSAIAQPFTATEALAWLGFELQDDHPLADPAHALGMRQRLQSINGQMAEGLQQRGLYSVVDLAPHQARVEVLRAQHEFLYRCNACLGDLGPVLGVRLVALGWVQRVSDLILNVNVAVHDVVAERDILTKSVDMRGNNTESWTRAVNFMLRDWSDRRRSNARYGL